MAESAGSPVAAVSVGRRWSRQHTDQHDDAVRSLFRVKPSCRETVLRTTLGAYRSDAGARLARVSTPMKGIHPMKRAGLFLIILVAPLSSWSAAQDIFKLFFQQTYQTYTCCERMPSIFELCIYEVDPDDGTTTTIWTGDDCGDGADGAYEINSSAGIYITSYERSTTVTALQQRGGGIRLFNPVTKSMTTLAYDRSIAHPYEVIVNQDGDFILGTEQALYKVTRKGAFTTLVSSLSLLPRTGLFNAEIKINIDTGNYLVCDSSVLSTLRYPVLEVAPDGTVMTWSASTGYGWFGVYGAPQNHRTGHIEGPYMNNVFELQKGGTRTTLGTLSLPAPLIGPAEFDLQTAPNPRWIAIGYSSSPARTYVYKIDQKTHAVTTFEVRKSILMVRDFVFKASQHIQTQLTGTHKWDICLSCPRFSNRNYVLVAGVSGVRPGIRLAAPDDRNINLNFDALTYATLNNLLPGVWSAGSGTLDAYGNAKGALNLSMLKPPPGGFGIPIWIVMAVLDSRAPNKIAYLPNTYVMRI